MDLRRGLERVSFAYEEKQVLSRLDLALPERGGICLFGPSGCGKSTILRLLAGLEQPGEGRVVGMRELRITLLFQENRLIPWCSALENVALGAGGGRAGRVRAGELLDAVGLTAEAERLPEALSGGMQRRVALARALAREGEALLLDEPLKELDTDTALRMRALIREHAKGKLLVLVTHDLEEAKSLCERVLACSGLPFRVEGEL